MKVEDLMTRDVKTCHRGTNLAEVASVLWESDCGALPVVDDDHKVVGIISDRDICFAVATKGRLASEVAVGEITGGRPVFTCTSNTSIQEALATMQQQQVRRIPVVSRENKIEGILSISDVVLAAQKEGWGNQQGVSNNEAISTLKAICERRHTAPNAAASASSAAQA
jgi:CBS domain-containing protein